MFSATTGGIDHEIYHVYRAPRLTFWNCDGINRQINKILIVQHHAWPQRGASVFWRMSSTKPVALVNLSESHATSRVAHVARNEDFGFHTVNQKLLRAHSFVAHRAAPTLGRRFPGDRKPNMCKLDVWMEGSAFPQVAAYVIRKCSWIPGDC